MTISYLSSRGGRLNVFDYTILLFPRCHPVRRASMRMHTVVVRVYHITLLWVVHTSYGEKTYGFAASTLQAYDRVLGGGRLDAVLFDREQALACSTPSLQIRRPLHNVLSTKFTTPQESQGTRAARSPRATRRPRETQRLCPACPGLPLQAGPLDKAASEGSRQKQG